MTPDNSYISRSGQKWKVNISFGFLGVGGLMIFGALIFKETLSELLFGVILLSGIFFGVVWFALQVLTIRCKKCGANLGWLAFNGKWTIGSETCAICDDDALQ